MSFLLSYQRPAFRPDLTTPREEALISIKALQGTYNSGAAPAVARP